jgi:hypothetical protein
MNNFDLKKFLTENKLTSNSKVLSEALNKTLQELGPALSKRLKAEGFEKVEVSRNDIDGAKSQELNANFKQAYIDYKKYDTGNEHIILYIGGTVDDTKPGRTGTKTSKNRIVLMNKILNYFNIPEGQYGPTKDMGWVEKNAFNKNDGDIIRSKVSLANGLISVSIFRVIQGNYKNVKTTDKVTGKVDFYNKAAE